ncbi:MAG: sigma-54-dependent Fis family transcriptional regulator, partial [Verrucomicrobia bacterium]|nr:sigma-54-dependent Fis family transcriptional regulator [Verrucomicrobiota bacterium]
DPEIHANHLYLDSTISPSAKESLKAMTLHEMEKRLILKTLEENHQNRTRTADILGISVRTLRNKLHEYGDSPDD